MRRARRPEGTVVPFPPTVRARNAARREIHADALRIAHDMGMRHCCKDFQRMHALFYGTSLDGRKAMLAVAEQVHTAMPWPRQPVPE